MTEPTKLVGTESTSKNHPSRRQVLGQMLVATTIVASQPSLRLMGHEPGSAGDAREAAKVFLGKLTEAQRTQANIDFKDHKRVEWHFIPMETRKGLPLRDMNDEQIIAAIQLMRQVLSEQGFQRALHIMGYESILLELEGPSQQKRRDYKKFYFAIYGNVERDDAWGLSIEGHHLSLNYTFRKDAIVDSTPQFFGVNPADLRRDFNIPDLSKPGQTLTFKKGTRLLKNEEDAGFELLRSLGESQLQSAHYTKECPDDIQWAGEPQPKLGDLVGVRAAELDDKQLKKLQALIEAFLKNMPTEVQSLRMDEITKAGLEKVRFGWAGGTQPGEQHFYRVQGPTFIAELCNFQTDPEGNVANHIHSVWRDMNGDFDQPLSAS